MKIYEVGGAVRDALRIKKLKTKIGLLSDLRLKKWCPMVLNPLEKISCISHPTSKEEYALARTERKTGHGYHGFNFYYGKEVTLEEDLLRRDLTVNAIAKDSDGNIIDPMGAEMILRKKYSDTYQMRFQKIH